MLVALWGLPEDPPLRLVDAALQQRGVPVLWIDQRCLAKISIKLKVNNSASGQVSGTLTIGTRQVDLSEISAIYLRPENSQTLSQVQQAGVGSRLWQHGLAVDQALFAWTSMTTARVLNRLDAMASNTSKPYQLQLIRQVGWQVPETLLTTDPSAVQTFQQQHPQLIYKSVSSIRSQVSQLKPEQLSRLSQVATCPTQFQRQIPGVDYRVHVVGDAVFACQIQSPADDYRYAATPADQPILTPVQLSPLIRQRCVDVAHRLGLSLAGIDLRRTPDDRWYCFEVNPSPGYSYYQEATGLAISDAIAEFLIKGNCS